MVRPNRRVHVLHVVPALKPGGMELALSRVVRGLSNHFCHSIICVKGEPMLADVFDSSVAIHSLQARHREFSLPLRMSRLLRMIRPDVIHARNWGAWPDISVAARMVRPSVPVIWSFHGLDGIGPVPFRRRLGCRALSMITSRIFTVSKGAKDVLVKQVGLSPRGIDIIPNGIDVSQFQPTPRRHNSGLIKIGSAGRLTRWKNHAMLLKAVAALRDRGLRCRLEIAGDGSEHQHLMALAQQMRIQDIVTLPGWKSDIAAFLEGQDIFVLPSLCEANPNVLLEAMACGLACIGTRVGGVPEILEDGRCGLLVDPHDVGELTDALASLTRDEHKRRELGIIAREKVCRAFSLQKMIESYAALYDAVASSRKYPGSSDAWRG